MLSQLSGRPHKKTLIFAGFGACIVLCGCHVDSSSPAQTAARQPLGNMPSAVIVPTAVMRFALPDKTVPPRYKLIDDAHKRLLQAALERSSLRKGTIAWEEVRSPTRILIEVEQGKMDHAAYLRNGVLQDLGVLQHPFSSINTHGQAVGSYVAGREGDGLVEGGDGRRVVAPSDMAYHDFYHAFLWERGKLRDLGTLPGGKDSQAECINDRGQIVGNADRGDYTYPVEWKNSKPIILPPGDEPGKAAWVNNNGDIAGDIYSQGQRVACLWQNNKMTHIGTLGGHSSTSNCINDQGAIVGHADVNGYYHGFLYRDGTMYDLGILPGYQESYAKHINNYGEIVGEVIDSPRLNRRAVLWHQGVIYDLNTLLPSGFAWKLTDAVHITDAGYIRCSGWRNGEERKFLLMPQSKPTRSAKPPVLTRSH